MNLTGYTPDYVYALEEQGLKTLFQELVILEIKLSSVQSYQSMDKHIHDCRIMMFMVDTRFRKDFKWGPRKRYYFKKLSRCAAYRELDSLYLDRAVRLGQNSPAPIYYLSFY